MMKNTDQKVSDTQLLPHDATTIIYTPDDRDNDVALLPHMRWALICGLFLAIVMIVTPYILMLLTLFFTNLQAFAIPYGVGMMGLCSVVLLTAAATRNPAKWHIRTSMLTSVLLAAFAAMTLCPWTFMWLVRVALAAVIAVLQIGLLLWTIRTCPHAEIEIQDAFYGSLKSVSWIATTVSLALLFKSFVPGLPPMWSFACSVACLWWFAYGTFVASLVCQLDKWNEPTVFSCDAVSDFYRETHVDFWWKPTFPIGWTINGAIVLVLFWPLFATMDWIIGPLFPFVLSTLSVIILQQRILAACRFHILPNASIVVETMNKSYMYNQVLYAEVESTMIGPIPKHTEKCHVYCASSPTERVKMQLSGERLLYVTPQDPVEFANAITSAIR